MHAQEMNANFETETSSTQS